MLRDFLIMRFNFKNYAAITVTLLCFSHVSFTSSVVACGTGTYDYGDAYESSNGTVYGEACHDTNRWQQLGKADDGNLEGDSDTVKENEGWTGETSRNNEDLGDNSVSWRVQNPDESWTAFGNEALTAGDNVHYKFIVTRSSEGNHQFDQLKAWIDWNSDGTFDDSESIIDKKWYKDESQGKINQISGSTVSYNNDLNANNSLDIRGGI
jgi:hypothetical protein